MLHKIITVTIWLLCYLLPIHASFAQSLPHANAIVPVYCDYKVSSYFGLGKAKLEHAFLGTGSLILVENLPMLLSHRNYLNLCHQQHAEDAAGLSILYHNQWVAIRDYNENDFWRVFLGRFVDATVIQRQDALTLEKATAEVGVPIHALGYAAANAQLQALPPVTLVNPESFYKRFGIEKHVKNQDITPFAYIASLALGSSTNAEQLQPFLSGPVFNTSQQLIGYQALFFTAKNTMPAESWHIAIIPTQQITNWLQRPGFKIEFQTFEEWTTIFERKNNYRTLPLNTPTPISALNPLAANLAFGIRLIENTPTEDAGIQLLLTTLSYLKHPWYRDELFQSRLDAFQMVEYALLELGQACLKKKHWTGWGMVMETAIRLNMLEVFSQLTEAFKTISITPDDIADMGY